MIALALIALSLSVPPPTIVKLGTIDCDMVEASLIVFQDKLLRFEYVRENYHANKTGASYFRFVDVATGATLPAFAEGRHLGSVMVWNGVMYVLGVPSWGASEVHMFWSRDLVKWESKTVISQPGWQIFNTSFCRGPSGFTMALELGAPPEEVGVAFTTRFARSENLREWEITPSNHVYTRERYSACPALRYLDGRYYMVYLEAYPGPKYAPHIVRSPDLVEWESSPCNPIMEASDDDRRLANPGLSASLRTRIETAVNLNNSDVEFCEFKGKTVIVYSWGNQQGIEHLATAEFAAPEEQFLKSFFPDPN